MELIWPKPKKSGQWWYTLMEMFRNLLDTFSLSWPEIGTITFGVLNVLKYLNKKGIFHRYIKGEQRLITNGGVYWTHLEISIIECCVGKPPFMAQGVQIGQAYGCNAEVWSTGMTIVQMINQAHPYNGFERNTVMHLTLSCVRRWKISWIFVFNASFQGLCQ